MSVFGADAKSLAVFLISNNFEALHRVPESERAAMSEVEEKYLRARDEITALKRRSNDQEKTIMRLKTKLAIIERSLLAQGGTTPAAVELQARVSTLEQQKQKLIRRYKEMKLELDRATGSNARRTQRSGKVLVEAPKRHVAPPAPPSVVYDDEAEEEPAGLSDKAAEIVNALGQKLESLGQHVQELQRENERLKRREQEDREPERVAEVRDDGADMRALRASMATMDTFELSKEVHNKAAQLAILKRRFDSLNGRLEQEKDQKQQLIATADAVNGDMMRARGENMELRKKLARLELQLEGQREMEDMYDKEKAHNHALQGRMDTLLDGSGLFKRKDPTVLRKELEEKLRREEEARMCKLELDRLRGEREAQQVKVLQLQGKLTLARTSEASSSARAEAAELEQKKAARDAKLLSKKLSIYCREGVNGEWGFEEAELDRALGLAVLHRERGGGYSVGGEDEGGEEGGSGSPRRRRRGPMSQVAFLEHAHPTDLDDVSALQARLQAVQEAIGPTARELRRHECMNAEHEVMEEQLRTELQTLRKEMDGNETRLKQEVTRLAALAERRLETARTREAQLRQLLYAPDGGGIGSPKKMRQLRQQLQEDTTTEEQHGVGDTAFKTAAKAPPQQQRQTTASSSDPLRVSTDPEGMRLDHDLGMAMGRGMGGETPVDLDLDGNVLNIWIQQVQLEKAVEAMVRGKLHRTQDPTQRQSVGGDESSRVKYFIVVEFYDYEAQATPVMTSTSSTSSGGGINTAGTLGFDFNFLAQFKLHVDRDLIEHMAIAEASVGTSVDRTAGVGTTSAGGGRVDFELYCVHAASTRLIGRSSLPLRPLLGLHGRSVYPTAPLMLTGVQGEGAPSLSIEGDNGGAGGGLGLLFGQAAADGGRGAPADEGAGYVAGWMSVEMQMQRPLLEVAESMLGPRAGWGRIHAGKQLARDAINLRASTEAIVGQGAGTSAGALYSNPSVPTRICAAAVGVRYLRVQVLGCDSLPTRSSSAFASSTSTSSSMSSSRRQQLPPSAYVHYQLLGFEDIFTGVVEASIEPRFDHSVHWFPIHITNNSSDPSSSTAKASSSSSSSSVATSPSDMMARFLEDYHLRFSVLDDSVPEGVDNVIATTDASLSFAGILDSTKLGGRYELQAPGADGEARGYIYVDIQWSDE
jgi:hypothetical protein